MYLQFQYNTTSFNDCCEYITNKLQLLNHTVQLLTMKKLLINYNYTCKLFLFFICIGLFLCYSNCKVSASLNPLPILEENISYFFGQDFLVQIDITPFLTQSQTKSESVSVSETINNEADSNYFILSFNENAYESLHAYLKVNEVSLPSSVTISLILTYLIEAVYKHLNCVLTYKNVNIQYVEPFTVIKGDLWSGLMTTFCLPTSINTNNISQYTDMDIDIECINEFLQIVSPSLTSQFISFNHNVFERQCNVRSYTSLIYLDRQKTSVLKHTIRASSYKVLEREIYFLNYLNMQNVSWVPTVHVTGGDFILM